MKGYELQIKLTLFSELISYVLIQNIEVVYLSQNKSNKQLNKL